MINRRQFLGTTAGLIASGIAPRAFAAAAYDLVIKGGHVIDPSQKRQVSARSNPRLYAAATVLRWACSPRISALLMLRPREN